MKKTFFTLLILCTVLIAKSQTVVTMTTPGKLKATITAMGINPDTVTNLKIIGSINAQDFVDVRDSTSVKTLDISSVNIVAYTGTDAPELPYSSKKYPANYLPDYAFAPQSKSIILTSITLPDNLDSIGTKAFYSTPLTSITIPGNTLKSIRQQAIYTNPNLQSVTFPSTVTSIGLSAFSKNPLLTSLTLPDALVTIGNSAFADCFSLSQLNYSGNALISIGATAFTNTLISSFNIPASVVKLDSTTFRQCPADINVDPANTVYSSANGALYSKDMSTLISCPTSKTSFTIPSSVTKIGQYAFSYSKLTSIAIPSSVQYLGRYAFTDCYKLASVDNSSATYKTIYDYAFQKDSALLSFTIPASVKQINSSAFINSGLNSIYIPATVDSIQSSAFSTCYNLTTATFDPNSQLQSFGVRIFSNCKKLETATLPTNLKLIPDYTFNSCSQLKNVTIPSSANFKTIRTYAFYFCTSLENINIPATTKNIGPYAFDGCQKLAANINIPASCDTLGLQAFGRSQVYYNVDASNTKYSSVNGVLFDKKVNRLIHTSPKATGRHYTIPSTVITLDQNSFYNDSLLTYVNIPATVKKMKTGVFWNCVNLTTIIANNPTPLTGSANMGSSCFQSVSKQNCILYVPDASVTAYSAANYWKDFEQVEPISNLPIGQDKFYEYSGLGVGLTSGVSPNGEYILHSNGYLVRPDIDTVKIDGNSFRSIESSINNDGVFVGVCPDPAYTIGTSTVNNAAIYKNNQWHLLGGGQLTLAMMGTSSSFGSTASAVSANGKVIAGMSYNRNNKACVVPFKWTIDDNCNVIDTVTYAYPAGGQGARFLDIADDGIRGCGWAVYPETKGSRRAIVFKSPTEYKILEPNYYGEALDISPNGKYVAFYAGGKAGLYDIDKDSITWCGNVSNTISNAVSNNGIILGYQKVYDADNNETRHAFIWSEKMGYTKFSDFFKTYYPNITLPKSTDFSQFYIYDVPMGISEDGRVFIGWSGFSSYNRWGWAAKFQNVLDIPQRPLNLKAVTDILKRNTVDLTWTIKQDPSKTLTGFQVYRDSVLIKEITDPALMTYKDENVPAGYPVYNVKAVYGNSISPYSDYSQVMVVDNYQLPLSENFESANFNTNYWTITNGLDSYWAMDYTGIYNSICLDFYTVASKVPYQATMKSKPLDASQASNVYLTYLYRVKTDYTTGVTDTLYVEVSTDPNGNNWTLAKKYLAIQQSQILTPERIDLSSLVAGKLFNFRFRMSGKNYKSFDFFIDNISVTTSIPEAPKNLIITKQDDKQKVFWQNSAGSYELTYSTTDINQAVGDEGVQFIAANKFDVADTKALQGKYLTSISTYINQTLSQSTATPTKLKLAVFVDNTRVVDQDINSFTPNAWNTFKIDNPVAIPTDKSLIFGIDVVEHDTKEMPLNTDGSAGINGKGNLFSENGGKDWQKLSDFSLTHNWSIIGNVRESAGETERGDVIGYELYRDGVKVNKKLFFNAQYTDSTNLSIACYTVKAFYNRLGYSDNSTQYCFNGTGIKTVNNDLYQIPSVVHSGFNLELNDKKVDLSIMDLTGKQLLSKSYSGNSYVDFRNYANGMYMVVISDGKNIFTQKVIKQ